jgi:hypothetical protein
MCHPGLQEGLLACRLGSRQLCRRLLSLLLLQERQGLAGASSP